MPPKRTWSQTNDLNAAAESPSTRPRVADAAHDGLNPSISRKVKACAACRKQKIKCIMDDSGPPCKRCAERHLSCVLNKSLQTLIEERSQWKDVVISDLSQLHAALQETLAKLSLPRLPPLQVGAFQDSAQSHEYKNGTREDEAPSCDDSNPTTPQDGGISHAPIDSLYDLTRLSAFRSDHPRDDQISPSRRRDSSPPNDFISKGFISIQEAERLFTIFSSRIDHFMYMVGSGTYRSLDDARRSSPKLTACILAVAALHDPNGNTAYAACRREFRRLMEASMLQRMDQNDFRAMCIASYWLHDVSWTVAGYAIIRAMEVDLSSNYQRVLLNSNNDAMNNLRIWYILYICCRHLSILYGRSPILRDDGSIVGWEKLKSTDCFTESDKRMVSQMALLIIMGKVRELFGPDTGEPFPVAFASTLMDFSRQIDRWMGHWSTELLKDHEFIGQFPTKGANLHHHLAKLHLHCHVFRGLKGTAVPPELQDNARAAVTAASFIVNLVLTDPDIRDGLVGMPHYIHSMISFACVFLFKITTQYPHQYIEHATVVEMITKLAVQFRATQVSKWHLVHMMAAGLEKMIEKAKGDGGAVAVDPPSNGMLLPGIPNMLELEPTLAMPLNGEVPFGDIPFGGAWNDGFNPVASSFLDFFNNGAPSDEYFGFNF